MSLCLRVIKGDFWCLYLDHFKRLNSRDVNFQQWISQVCELIFFPLSVFCSGSCQTTACKLWKGSYCLVAVCLRGVSAAKHDAETLAYLSVVTWTKKMLAVTNQDRSGLKLKSFGWQFIVAAARIGAVWSKFGIVLSRFIHCLTIILCLSVILCLCGQVALTDGMEKKTHNIL